MIKRFGMQKPRAVGLLLRTGTLGREAAAVIRGRVFVEGASPDPQLGAQ